MKTRRLFFALSVLLLYLTACNRPATSVCNGDHSAIIDSTRQATRAAVLDSIRRQATDGDSTKLSGLFILDGSESMKGYQGEFKNIIANLSHDILRVDSNKICWSKEENKRRKGSFVDPKFDEKSNERKFAWGGETQLSEMFSAMAYRIVNGQNDIACLITDGILSGSNEQIQKSPNRRYNIENSETLKNQIVDSLQLLNANGGYSALIVRYVTDFDGSYFTYNNSYNIQNKRLKGSRPFYAIILGKSDKVQAVEKDLKEGRMKGKNGMRFQFTDMVMIGSMPKFEIPSPTLDRRTKDGEEAVFAVNITSLPLYMQDSTWFNKHIECLHECYGNWETIDSTYQSIQIKHIDGGQTYAYITIRHIDNVKPFRHRFVLRNGKPLWVENYNSPNDSSIFENPIEQTKTFLLSTLVEAFECLGNGMEEDIFRLERIEK